MFEFESDAESALAAKSVVGGTSRAVSAVSESMGGTRSMETIFDELSKKVFSFEFDTDLEAEVSEVGEAKLLEKFR